MIPAGPTREIIAVRFILMDALLFLALPEEEQDGSVVSAPSGWAALRARAPSREQDPCPAWLPRGIPGMVLCFFILADKA